MKQIYLLLMAAGLLLPTLGWAQYGGQAFLPPEDDRREATLQELQSPNRAVACGLDTVQYPLFKAFDGPNPTQLDLFGIKDPGYSRLAQYYPAPDTILFNGVDFFARNAGSANAPMSIKVFLAGPDSLPTGNALVNVTFDLAPDTVLRGYSLGLSNPVQVSDDYLITIETTASDTVYVGCSEWTQDEGNNEWLANAGAAAFWQRGYDVLIDGQDFNGDVILMPHVAYIVDVDQTVDPECIAPGNEISFRSGISNILFSPVYNRFYNPYSSFFSPDSNFTWYFGDGDSSFVRNPTHTYNFTAPLPDSVEVSLIGLHLGYSFFCPDEEAINYEVQPAADASFTVDDSSAVDTFTFRFAGSAETWVWDFGDGSQQVFNDTMPSHTYANFGEYTVTLMATGCSTMDTVSFTVSYENTSSLTDNLLEQWQVYPNPSEGALFLMPGADFGAVSARLLDGQGRTVARQAFHAVGGSAQRWELTQLPAGIYWLEIQQGEQRLGTKVRLR